MSKQEIFILAITGIVFIITLGGRPFIGLLHYQLYAGLYLSNIFINFHWLRLPFTTSIVVLISLLIHHSKNIFISSQAKLMGAMFGVMCLSRYFNGLDVFGNVYMVFFYKIIFAHIIITSIIDNEEKHKIFLWLLVISGTILAFVARYNDSEVAYDWMNKNDFARNLVCLISLPVLFSLLERKLILKVEALCYFIILIYGIIGSNSRGGYVALTVVLSLLLVTNFTIKRMLLLILLTGIVFMRASHVHLEKFISIHKEAQTQTGTGGQRLAAWRTAMKMIKANPVLGVGTGEFPNKFVEYSDYEDKISVGGIIGQDSLNTHNMILQVGAENGISGLAIFLLIIIFSFRDIIKVLRLCRGDPELSKLGLVAKAVFISLIGFIIAGLFGNAGYDLMFFTLVSLAVISRRVTAKVRERDKKVTEKQREIPIIFYRYSLVFRTLFFILFAYICLPL